MSVRAVSLPLPSVTQTVERYLGVDPGGERLRSALYAVAAWFAAIAAAAFVESQTHAFEIAASAPGAAAFNHTARLVVLMIASTVALNASFVVGDATGRGRLVSSFVAAAGLWSGVALAVAVHGSRPISLVLLVLVPSVGAWFRRFGIRGLVPAFTAHVGFIIGFLVAAPVGVGRLGWVAAVIAVSAAATCAVGLLALRGHRQGTRRMARSYHGRARRVLAMTDEVMQVQPGSASERALTERLRRQVVRLNETALVLDLRLAGDATGVGDTMAQEARRRALFEHERAVVLLSRLARGTEWDATQTVRGYARAVVAAARDSDVDALRALAGTSLQIDHGDVAGRYRDAARVLAVTLDPVAALPDPDAPLEDDDDLLGNVSLLGGWLPGAAMVNAAVSSTRRPGWMGRLAMNVNTRVSIQLAVALTAAVTVADLISPAHVVWAVIAVYVSFLGSASDREQSRKAAFRVAGTLAGVAVGQELAQLTALHLAPTLFVMAAAVFFLNYLGRVNYALVVFAATLGVTQFYAQVGQLTHTVLLQRVEVTTVGAACAIAVSLLVLPLRAVHAATLALGNYLRSLATLLNGIGEATPRRDLRMLNASYHTATAALRPLTITPFGTNNDRCGAVLRLVDLTHELGTALAHDSIGVAIATTNTSAPATQLAVAASLATAVADDLDRRSPPTRGRALPPPPAPPPAPRPTAGSFAELADLTAALGELASIRGVTVGAADPSFLITAKERTS